MSKNPEEFSTYIKQMKNMEKNPGDLSFDEYVDKVAGLALTRLIKGENWRSIIWSVCHDAAWWQSKQNKRK